MEKVRLCEVCDFQGGSQPPKDEWSFEQKDGYIRMLQIRDFTQTRNVEKEYIKLTSSTKTCEVDDVLIARYGASVGKILTGLSGAYNVAIMKTIPNERLLSKSYLKYYLLSDYFQNRISNVGERAAQAGFNKEDLSKLHIILVPIEEQKIITEVLDKVSALISIRKKQLSKMDELVKARFVELFGEWNSNPEPLKSFLKDITYGFTNPMPDAEEGPWKVTAKDVVNGKVNYDTARKTTVQAFEELTAKSKPTVGDVLLTKDGTLGRCAVVEEDGICVNQSVAVLKCNEKILPKFLAILLQMPEYQREMLKNAGGGTIKHIYITKVVDMLIVVPTISQQMEFLSFVEQTDKSKLEVQKSLEKLELLKKALMQKYFE